MQSLITLLAGHGVPVVFAVTLAARAGAPLPAAPLLVVAGGLAATPPVAGPGPWLLAFAAALLANLAGDAIWFAAGRRHGRRVMGLLCRLSLSPDSCVRQSESLMTRWGGAALVAAKFVPGVSVVAAPMAGALGMSAARFVAWDLLAGGVWSLLFLGLGAIFWREVDAVLAGLGQAGAAAGLALVALLAGFAGWRAWRRRRFLRALAMQRIGVDELRALIDDRAGQGAPAPVIVDVRGADGTRLDPRRIPGARSVALPEVVRALQSVPRDQEIVVYCNCPNEASAAMAARALAARGYHRVRPLAGGLEAWAEAGHPVAVHEEAGTERTAQ